MQEKSLRYYNSIATIATMMAMCGFMLDIALSLMAYTQNPSYFLQYEANKELVSFLSLGTVPIMMYIQPTFIIFLHFLNRFFVGRYHETSRGKIIYQFFIINMFFMGFTRLCGGLTWYVYPMRFFIFHFQIIGLILYVAYAITVVLAAVEKEKKVKTLKLAS